MKMTEFKNLIQNENILIDFLILHEILKIPICNKCQKPMTKTKNCYIYRCYLRRNGKKCSNEGSLYRNSFFAKSQVNIQTLLLIVCEWIKKSSVTGTSIECDISKTTISNWFAKLDQLVFNFLYLDINSQQIGGIGCVVEIDETVLTRNKYKRGRLMSYQTWAVGGVVRGDPSTFFIEIVADRKRTTLIEIIRRKIRPGTVIMTDGWKGYLGFENICADLGYEHQMVNHSKNFVDGETGAHTQTIEGMWSVVKRELRKTGTNHGDLFNLIRKIYIYRFKLIYRNNIIEKMLELLKTSS